MAEEPRKIDLVEHDPAREQLEEIRRKIEGEALQSQLRQAREKAEQYAEQCAGLQETLGNLLQEHHALQRDHERCQQEAEGHAAEWRDLALDAVALMCRLCDRLMTELDEAGKT